MIKCAAMFPAFAIFMTVSILPVQATETNSTADDTTEHQRQLSAVMEELDAIFVKLDKATVANEEAAKAGHRKEFCLQAGLAYYYGQEMTQKMGEAIDVMKTLNRDATREIQTRNKFLARQSSMKAGYMPACPNLTTTEPH